MIALTQEFGFDAAHYMPFKEEGHDYRRLHGHSFYAEVRLTGEIDPSTGWVRDLGEVRNVLDEIRTSLDHRLLNEIAGLENPTLENLARYIFDAAKAKLPEVSRVTLRRPSYGQTCVYEV